MTPDLETRLELACDPVNHAWRHDRDRLCKRAATELRARAERIAALEKLAGQMAEALEFAADDLRTVGDDYPGSSCHKWCHERAREADKALNQFNAFQEKCGA